MEHANCAVNGCDHDGKLRRGMCNMHYKRYRRTGDPGGVQGVVRVPNRHSVRRDGVAQGVITRSNGDTHVFVYDLADYPVVSSRQWYLAHGYVATAPSRAVNRSTEYLHRILMGLTRGDLMVVDHRSGDPLDNRRSNLRVVTPHFNSLNRAVRNGQGSSTFRGVSWATREQRWYAYARLGGKMHNLGQHATEAAAAAVVAAFRIQHGLPPGY